MTFVCTPSQVDETAQAPAEKTKPSKPMDVRDAVMNLWGIAQWAKRWPKGFEKIRNLEVLTYYAIEAPTRRRRRPMDVPRMVESWKAVIVTLCTAHDKADIDKAEYRMDELLTPILAAPVAQLREFYAKLSDALKADRQVPFFIWSMFRVWGKFVEDAEDRSKLKRLRKKLAGEIADMVEQEVQPDIASAIVGALMWRDPEQLEEIKADLQSGARPRLRGRESCLFLVTEKGRGAKARELHQVML